jgi:AcrR family transcriptional regulator
MRSAKNPVPKPSAPDIDVNADGRSTPDRILDAAEKLWAHESYGAASIRRIMTEAGLEFSLARYYFGRKEDLYRQVIARRASAHCASTFEAFDRAVGEAVDGIPTLEAWIDAFIQPVFDKLEGTDEGWRNYSRLLSDSAALDQSQSYLSALHEHFGSVISRFLSGLRLISPELKLETSMWSLYFLHAASVSIFRNSRIMDPITRGRIRTHDYAQIRLLMAPFFASGFRALAAQTQQGEADALGQAYRAKGSRSSDG